MAELKRHVIELVKNVEEVEKGGEVEIEKFWTPPFIKFKVVQHALQIQEELQGLSELEATERLADFIAKEVFNGAFTVEELFERLHAPDALKTLEEQLIFVTQGEQSDATKKFLDQKKK